MIPLMQLKQIRQILGSLSLIIPLTLIASCTQQQTSQSPAPTTETQASPTADSTKPRLAIVLGGPANDDSWNEAAYNAAEKLKAQGYDVAISESVADADIARVLRQYAEKGYNVIIGHSYNHGDAVFQVAKEFPKTNFAWAGAVGKTSENVADYDQPFYQGAYMVGLVAGKLSKSGKLGALYGFDIPACHAMGQAMLAGAKTVRPDATLTATAVGDWYDIAKAKEAGTAQAETGVDYWIGCGQAPTLGTIEAAKAKGGYATGYVGDMTALGQNVVAANVLWNMEPIFKQMLNDTTSGQFANKYYRLSVAEDVVQVNTNSTVKDKLGDETLKKIEETRQEISSGKLKVPFVPK
ncbi:BMP family protein [Trichocoleus sp. FACHB-6]|nr:BMP family protein [Trichocoleus sp. FACHB-832]MBD2063874.1 BMP family protein [Trichocoleus sp. FACHB-6]